MLVDLSSVQRRHEEGAINCHCRSPVKNTLGCEQSSRLGSLCGSPLLTLGRWISAEKADIDLDIQHSLYFVGNPSGQWAHKTVTYDLGVMIHSGRGHMRVINYVHFITPLQPPVSLPGLP